MVRVTCVVENTAPEESGLRSEHGVAFWVETGDGQVLFDTGQSGDALLHNAAALGIDLAAADALVFSHAHYDHTGGVQAFMALAREGLPLYANATLFRARFSERAAGLASIGFPLENAPDVLAAHFDLRLSDAPQEVLRGVWTTGAIMARPYFEGRSAGHQARVDDRLVPDPYADDLSLVLETDEGLVVVCGCCHAGLLNTLAHVRGHFARPVRAVLGGTHLTSATEADLAQAAAVLRDEYGAPALYPNHCTGERAYAALAESFGARVQPCPGGTVLDF
ncbi:MAG: MBL fold metallo-hydrolase [Anaerolineae bacterium]|nr:MBL fold metallo-hydrolase [Anaerolineae bacterium]